MKTRHRAPSIFNLSMVDVMCCALGCVILLWLLNLREAKEKALEAGDITVQLDSARANLEENAQRLAQREQEINKLEGDLKSISTREAELQAKLQTTEKDLKAGRKTYEATAAQLKAADERLRFLKPLADLVPGLRTELKERQEKLAAADALIKVLNADLEREHTAVAASVQDLKDLQVFRKKMEADLASKDKALADARLTREQLLRAQEKITTLDQELSRRVKELATAERIIEKLQGDKKTLAASVDRVKAAQDNRFEGIALSGKRVIFLVDMSGSMELVDEHTPAPNKWAGVRETVVRIMKSLPELEKFQIIVFAEKTKHILGKEGQWFDFDPVTSIDQVSKALAELKPKGGTNMYAALDESFGYRSRGLDTIYLLSDGLPNLGEGLTAEQERTLKETEQGEILGKYIRKMLKTDWNRANAGQRVRINTVGFFFESPDVGAFLWALARENDGGFVGMSRP